MSSILITDDDKSTVESLSFIFKKEKFNIYTASNGNEAIKILKENIIDIVLTDFMMDGIDGFELLKITKKLYPNTVVILMTAYGTVNVAVDALKAGAEDFIIKPLKKQIVLNAVNKALKKQILQTENKRLKEELEVVRTNKLIGQSLSFRRLMDKINIISKSPSTVLMYGESGTGKEVIAKYIHENSLLKNNRFIAINIASLSESLIESELFGYLKGAFTGADKDKEGYLMAANNGTLFLDEISELPMHLQVKLLRFIQEGEVTPIGSTVARKVDVRIIVATNKRLLELIKDGKFREDLYYRLKVIPIELPPLRERKDDISLLAMHFIRKHSIRQKKDAPNITTEVITALRNYSWPGNVRELENLIENLVVFNNEIIELNDLPEEIVPNKVVVDENYLNIKIGVTTIKEVEQLMILRTLEFTKGDKNLASKILGISPKTIYRKYK